MISCRPVRSNSIYVITYGIQNSTQLENSMTGHGLTTNSLSTVISQCKINMQKCKNGFSDDHLTFILCPRFTQTCGLKMHESGQLA